MSATTEWIKIMTANMEEKREEREDFRGHQWSQGCEIIFLNCVYQMHKIFFFFFSSVNNSCKKKMYKAKNKKMPDTNLYELITRITSFSWRPWFYFTSICNNYIQFKLFLAYELKEMVSNFPVVTFFLLFKYHNHLDYFLVFRVFHCIRIQKEIIL